jgi:hypothetical protein
LYFGNFGILGLLKSVSLGVLNSVWLQVWCINGSSKTPLPKEDVGKFYSGDCYIILYTYHSGDRKEDYLLCCWFGNDSSEVIYII